MVYELWIQARSQERDKRWLEEFPPKKKPWAELVLDTPSTQHAATKDILNLF